LPRRFNALYGFAAILNDDYFAEEEFLYGTVTVWGWLAVGFAVVMLITAMGLFAGSGIASLFGILIAAVNALVHAMAIGGHPVHRPCRRRPDHLRAHSPRVWT
jgi:hypothetical protein